MFILRPVVSLVSPFRKIGMTVMLLMLLGVIAPLVVVQPLEDEVVLPKLAATAVFTGAALVWGAVLLPRERWPAGRWPATIWIPVVVFVVVNVLALIFAEDWRSSLIGENWRFHGLATTLLYVLLFGVAAVAIRTTSDLRWLLLGLFAGALGAAIYALIQKAGLDFFSWSGREPDRPASTMGQQNTFAAFLVLAISASTFLVLTVKEHDARLRLAVTVTLMAALVGAFAFLLVRVDGWQQIAVVLVGGPVVAAVLAAVAYVWFDEELRNEALRYLLEAGLAMGIVLMVFALFFTVSRSGYLAAAAVWLLFGIAALIRFVPTPKEQRPRIAMQAGLAAAAVAPLAVALIVVLVGGLPVELGRVGERVEAAGNVESPEVSVRLTLWRMGMEMTGDRPLLGYGQDGFSAKFPEYRDQPDLPGIGTSSVDPESSHNFFVDLASDTGVLGLLSFLALVGAVLWHAGRRALKTDDGSLRLALVSLSGAVIGYLVAIFFGFSEAITSWAFWLVLGAMAGLVARVAPVMDAAEESSPESGTLASGLTAVGLLLMGAVALGWAGTIVAADLAAAQARGAANRGSHGTAVELAGRAVTLNPLKNDYLALRAKSYERAASELGEAEASAQAVRTYGTLLSRFAPTGYYTWKRAMAEADLADALGLPVQIAFPDMERAVELDPYNLSLRESVARFYEREGFAGLAFRHWVVIHCWTAVCDLSE